MSPISRRGFLRVIGVSGMAVSANGARITAAETQPSTPTTRYLAAYDTESPGCLAACRKIVEAHKRFAMPATFFITGKTLEANAAEYRELFGHPLFEVASHTYSHRMLKDNPICGLAIALDEKRVEICKSKEIIEGVFQRPCLGLRPGCGFADGFRGAPELLGLIAEAGYAYTSSWLWGPDYSLPALLTEPFRYEKEGFPDLWELPGHGWHENLLKNNNKMGPRRLTLWPPEMPEAIPGHYLTTAEEEFAVNRVFIDKAVTEKKPYVTLIWHPWSLNLFDPAMKMLELTFQYVRDQRLEACTFQNMYEHLST
ncbi:MAG: polysaccharide deacetylase family protein [bacterium]